VPVTSAGLDRTATSAIMAGAYCNDWHAGLRQLNFWDDVEGSVLASLDGGGGWLGQRLGVRLHLGYLVRVVFRLRTWWASNVGTK
jgi:hypothetical protein